MNIQFQSLLHYVVIRIIELYRNWDKLIVANLEDYDENLAITFDKNIKNE